MTGFDYTRSRATADRLITKFGQAVVVRRKGVIGGTSYAPIHGPTNYSTFAAIVDYSTSHIDGTNILAKDRRAFVAAGPLAIVPSPGDALVVDGVALPIITVKPIDPAGVAVIYECQVRR